MLLIFVQADVDATLLVVQDPIDEILRGQYGLARPRVLELTFELPGASAISLQNGLKRLANHMRSDTSNVSNKIQLPNIQLNVSRLRIASGTSEGLGQTGMTSKDRITLYQDQGVQLLLGRFVKGEIVESKEKSSN